MMKKPTTTKRDRGAFYTTGVDDVLAGYEDITAGKHVVDPMCGAGHLLDWAASSGAAASTTGYDIIHGNDTIMEPEDYTGKLVLMNPPYLLSNKTKTIKAPYEAYGVDDLYKAALLSIQGAAEAIVIVPSNVLFDMDDSFRRRFYGMWHIERVSLFDKQMFADTNVRVCVLHLTQGTTTELFDEPLFDGTRVGKDWHDMLDDMPTLKRMLTPSPHPSITIFTTDTGSDTGCIHAEDGAYVGKMSDRNKYSPVLPAGVDTKHLAWDFNRILGDYREQYDSMFLTNFLAGRDGTTRKRISFRQANKLLAYILEGYKRDENIRCRAGRSGR